MWSSYLPCSHLGTLRLLREGLEEKGLIKLAIDEIAKTKSKKKIIYLMRLYACKAKSLSYAIIIKQYQSW